MPDFHAASIAGELLDVRPHFFDALGYCAAELFGACCAEQQDADRFVFAVVQSMVGNDVGGLTGALRAVADDAHLGFAQVEPAVHVFGGPPQG